MVSLYVEVQKKSLIKSSFRISGYFLSFFRLNFFYIWLLFGEREGKKGKKHQTIKKRKSSSHCSDYSTIEYYNTRNDRRSNVQKIVAKAARVLK